MCCWIKSWKIDVRKVLGFGRVEILFEVGRIVFEFGSWNCKNSGEGISVSGDSGIVFVFCKFGVC